MRRKTFPHKVRSLASRGTEALRASATQSHHSVDGPNSLEVATRGLLFADADVGTSEGLKGRLSCALLLPLLLSIPDPTLKVYS